MGRVKIPIKLLVWNGVKVLRAFPGRHRADLPAHFADMEILKQGSDLDVGLLFPNEVKKLILCHQYQNVIYHLRPYFTGNIGQLLIPSTPPSRGMPRCTAI